MGNFGMGEMLVALVIVLVLFGAKRVPEISASFGKGIREFKRNLNEVEESVTGGGFAARLDTRPHPAPPQAMSAEEEALREPKRLL
jgi:sec-independent protein translocase protein TatA